MEETLQIPQQIPFQEEPPLKKLWKGLYADKKYTKSFDEFKTQYSTPEAITKLHAGLNADGDYTKSIEDFQKQYFPEVKKKETTPSPSADTPLPYQKKLVGTVSVGETEIIPPPIEKDPIQLAQEADVLSKKGEATTAGNIDVFVPDEESVKQSDKIKEELKKQGFDADKLNRDFTGIPEEVYNVQGFSKPELLQQYKDNPQHYERMIATAKWQSDLHNQLKQQEGGEAAWHDLQSNMENIHVGNYDQQRGTLRNILNTVDKFGGDKREQIIKNLGIDFTNLYGKEAGDVEALSHDERYKRGDINSNQLAATHYLEDIHPEELRKYQSAFLKDEDIKDNTEAQLGKQEAAKKLDELGIQLRKSYLNEKFNPINKEYQSLVDKSTKEGLTPEEQQRAQELEIQGKPLFDQLSQANVDEQQISDKYPMASYYDTKNFAQELMGQQNTGIERFLTKTGEAVKNTGAGVYDFAAEPFRSKQEDEIRQAEILGSGKIDETISYLKQSNQINQTFKPELSKELQADIDKIKKDDSLSEPEKLQATTKLLMSRMGEWQRTPQMKTNLGLKSLMYGISDMAAGLVPFMGLEMVTGGGASAGLVRKLTSSFVSASATGFEEAYRDGIEKGEANPYAYATRVTAITSAAIAGAQTPDAIRKMFAGQKTAIGNLVSKMTDTEIEAALKESPKALKLFGKSLEAVKTKGAQVAKAFGSSAISGVKDAAKINAFMTGGKIANDAISGDLKTPTDYGKDFLIETLKFAIPSAVIGGVSKTLKPTDLSKSALYESAVNPDGILSSLEQKLKDGTITPEEGLQVKRNVETVSKIYQKNSPFFKSLDDKAKREYLYNSLTEVRAKEAAQGLPEKQAAKFEMEAEIAKHKNGLIIEPKAPDQLTKRKEQLEKSLIPEKDAEGKNIEIPEKEIFAAKAEIEAINQVLDEHEKTKAIVEAPVSMPKNIEIGENAEIAKANEAGISVEQPQHVPEPIQLDETGHEVKPTTQKEPIDTAKEIVNSGIVKGYTAETLKEAANSNPELFNQHLKEIAEQSQDPNSAPLTEKIYGKELVDIANELHPPKEPVPPTDAAGEGDGKTTGIKNKKSNELRGEFSLPKVEVPKLGKDIEVITEGKRLVDEGEVVPRDVVHRVLETKEGMHPNEAKAMQYYMHQLSAHENNLREQMAEAETPEQKAEVSGKLQQLSDEIDAATAANIIAGKAWSDVGNIRQILIDDAFKPSRERAIIKDAYGGEIPKDVQDRLDKLTKERDEAIAERQKAEEQLRQKMAAQGFEKIKKEASKSAKNKEEKEKLKEEEKKLLDDLKKAFRKDMGGLHSGIPIPKETLEALGKLAVNYFKQGVVGLEAMVDKIYNNLKDDVDGISKKDIRNAIANYEPLTEQREVKRLNTKADLLEDKVQPPSVTTKGNKFHPSEKVDLLKPSREHIEFRKSTEWVKANQRVANAEHKMKVEKRKAFESKKNFYQKGLAWAGRLTRLSILSGYNVLAKLGAAATVGAAGKRPVEQIIGAVYSKIFSGIAKKAPIEGGYNWLNARAEAAWYKDFFNPKKFVHNSWEILKSGSSDLGKRLGGAEYEHVPGLYLPTDLHQIIKDPVKRGTFEASFLNGMIWAEKNGLDIQDPLVINSIENAAYKRAQYEIFQEQNWLSRKFTSWKSSLEKAGNKGATAKFLVDFMIPVSTVPSNIVRRIVTTSPVGLIRGGKEVIQAYRKGIESLKPDEADHVMQQLKQGTLGTALWLIGWYGAGQFGGLYSKYNPDKKRREGELAHDEMSVGGKMIPKPVQHALPLEIIQFAATARHVYDNYVDRKGESMPQAIYAAGMGSIGALVEQIPVIETGAHVIGAFGNPYEAEKLKDDVKRRFEPQILRETGIIPKEEKKSGRR